MRNRKASPPPSLPWEVTLLLGVILTGLVVKSSPVYGQESESPSTTRFEQARWAAGIQAMPVPGVGIRRAITSRLDVQFAGVPGMASFDLIGGLGSRLLYRIDRQATRSLYVSGAYTILWLERSEPIIDFRSPDFDSSKPLHYGALTLGAEIALGLGVSLTVELGGAYVAKEVLDADAGWSEKLKGSVVPGGGVGLYVYW